VRNRCTAFGQISDTLFGCILQDSNSEEHSQVLQDVCLAANRLARRVSIERMHRVARRIPMLFLRRRDAGVTARGWPARPVPRSARYVLRRRIPELIPRYCRIWSLRKTERT